MNSFVNGGYMKRNCRFLVTLIVVFSLIGCSTSNNEERVATEFITSYYAQFERRSELEELRKSQFSEEKMELFITQAFDDLLTRDAKDKLVSNRLIPRFEVLDSNVSTAKISEIRFEKADNQIQGTLSFSATIKYTHDDGKVTKEKVTGFIRIINLDGKYKVDSFMLK